MGTELNLQNYREQLELKNEGQNVEELEKVFQLHDRIANLSSESQEEISRLIDDFADKQAQVSHEIMNEKWFIENWTDADSSHLKKWMKSVPWTGESVELLIRANDLGVTIDSKTPTRTGEQLWIILQQMNRIEGKGIDRALAFFSIYEKLAQTFLKFKAVKDRNDRAVAAYERKLNSKIEEISAPAEESPE